MTGAYTRIRARSQSRLRSARETLMHSLATRNFGGDAEAQVAILEWTRRLSRSPGDGRFVVAPRLGLGAHSHPGPSESVAATTEMDLKKQIIT